MSMDQSSLTLLLFVCCDHIMRLFSSWYHDMKNRTPSLLMSSSSIWIRWHIKWTWAHPRNTSRKSTFSFRWRAQNEREHDFFKFMRSLFTRWSAVSLYLCVVNFQFHFPFVLTFLFVFRYFGIGLRTNWLNCLRYTFRLSLSRDWEYILSARISSSVFLVRERYPD